MKLHKPSLSRGRGEQPSHLRKSDCDYREREGVQFMLAGCTPWPAGLAERYRQKGYWEDITLPEMLNCSVRDHAIKPALIFGERRISYRERP